MAKQELDELKSALEQLTLTIQTANNINSDTINAKQEEIRASKNAASADNEEAAASRRAASSAGGSKGLANALTNAASSGWKLVGSAVATANAMYSLGKILASIGEAGRKYAMSVGTTATQGAQFQSNAIKILLSDTRRFGADLQLTMEQIKGAAESFGEVFVGAADGMRISAKGSADFARSLSAGFKSEFKLTAQSMQALITVGAATTQQFEAVRKASGRAGLSSTQFANLINKNSLSFMLYGPRFAKAAAEAERLGISLSAVQKAQESMVTNLDGTIDTVAQINQLGGQIDFGTLTTLAETQGPEAVLSYLQSTIPPALFQSASTRALVSGLGIPLEDLIKRQGSVQSSAADKIEKAFTEVGRAASPAAQNLAKLNKNIMALDESKAMELMNASKSAADALLGLTRDLGAFAIALFQATLAAFSFAGSKVPGIPGGARTPGTTPGTPGSSSYFGGRAPGAAGPVSPTSTLAKTLRQQNPNLTPAQALQQARSELANTGYETVAPGKPGMFSRIKSALTPSGTPTRLTTTVTGGARTATRTITNLASRIPGAGLVTRVGGGLASGVGTSFARMGAMGVGAGILSTGMAGMDAYRSAMARPGVTKETAMGEASIAGGSAVIGTIVGGMLGPVGAAVGGALGGFVGKKINEKFPEFGKSIGDTFSKMKDAAMPLIDKLKEFWGIIKGPLFFALEIVGKVLGKLIVASFKVLGFVFTEIIAPVLGIVIDGLKLLAKGWVMLINFLIGLVNKLPGFNIPLIPETTPTGIGDDVVSQSGYGSRTLVTPQGSIALNNRDTVVAYADDMVSGIKTYSLGTIARQTGATTNDLGAKVDELISTILSANTTIQVGNTVQQVPRIALAGVYTRNERV